MTAVKPAAAYLLLEDGTLFKGIPFGYRGSSTGEVVFNTGMTGYQEVLTDPSYAGQIVTMTYPLIGNYGINAGDAESAKPQVRGYIVREACARPSNYRSEKTLDHYLAQHRIPGLAGIDTRSLTRRIREHGTLRGAIINGANSLSNGQALNGTNGSASVKGFNSANDRYGMSSADAAPWEGEALANLRTGARTSLEAIFAQMDEASYTCWIEYLTAVRNLPVAGPHLVSSVTTPQAYVIPGDGFRVAVLDFGIKENILRMLKALDCHLMVFPAHAPAEEIGAANPDGLFLSNGPGDPKDVAPAIETISHFLRPGTTARPLPIFGICLGHQLLGLAAGADTYKLKFGHRGANHPVKDLRTGRVFITSQNHGYAIDENTLPKGFTVSHRNGNDDTVEGLRHQHLPLYSVQYHPEAAPGPHDSAFLFDEFIANMQQRVEKATA
ncbi:carbamoyl-phosphate synthase, small subunit [Heliomicrobium modesticaldum Ice1]|uniref:Carbamoyl phosphate synthase small chain n=1 Tax=Heliobacterium modesticaldum (strain ATCC 51547 / Ice1) TaxID=498761 RepID=B0TCB0_HELMI|nr:carbamoyl phosphate synthase small subunit [Heliomicrobium modesticaldum]ABZ84009.1 carbamoyl-phosphate synthase, small subunit [Heliomicrobium modesticaldum Ice1]